MKKRQVKPYGEYRKPVLYLDDVEELVEIVGAASDGVAVEHGDCEYDSLTELLEGGLPERLNSLQIYGLPKYGAPKIDLSDGLLKKATASVSSNDDSSVAAFHRIDTVLKRCERVSFLERIHSWWFYSSALAFGFIFGSGDSAYDYPSVVISFFLFYLIWSLLVLWRYNQKVEVFLCRRHDKTSFFQRKKDELILIAISVVLTAMVTIPLTVYVQSLSGASLSSVGTMNSTNSTGPDS